MRTVHRQGPRPLLVCFVQIARTEIENCTIQKEAKTMSKRSHVKSVQEHGVHVPIIIKDENQT
jgi:hypothetical protein